MNERRDETDGEPYLWDRSGPADPLVARLEERLGSLRHVPGEAPGWLADAGAATVAVGPAAALPGSGRGRRLAAVLAAAALASLVLAGAWWWSSARGEPGWRVTGVAGAPRLAGEPLGGRGESLRPGQPVETGPGGRARLALAGVGEVELGPASRVVLVAAGDRQRLSLERGLLLASITAPPRVFEVATPRGLAVDLGCMFALEVEPDGGERLRVEAGWVALVAGGREAFVPAGATVHLPSGGPLEAPVYLSADRGLQRALRRYEGSSPADAGRAAALAEVLARARRQDALTLWHLVGRAEGDEQRRVYERLAELVPPPRGVSLAAVRRDPAARDRWWEALGLGTAAWWREWRVDPPAAAAR